MAAFMAVLGYTLAANPVVGPAFGNARDMVSAAEPVKLVNAGGEISISGSVASLFETPVFTAPSLEDHSDAFQPALDIADFAQSFATARTQLASLREPAKVPQDYGLKLSLEERLSPKAHALKPVPVRVATVDPTLKSAALAAIDQATQSDAPQPLSVPTQLAYARETTPTTQFSSPDRMQVSEKQFKCLATAVYFEARGEADRGQAAVAQVVLNRVKHALYPSTICGVVYQNQSKRNACQFSFACDGVPERISEPKAWDKAKRIAREVLSGEIYLTEVANATHYHATYVYPRWAKRMKRMTKIGLHVFYRFRSG